MNILKYILFFYAIFGILVSGGLLFNKQNKANIFLALYTLLFSFGQLSFLYNSTGLFYQYPQFSGIGIPFWFLFGPTLWFHIYYFNKKKKIAWKKTILHLIPFFIFLGFSIYLFTYSGEERIQFFRQNFNDIIMPLNYCIATHISIYGIILIIYSKKQSIHWSSEKKLYLNTIIIIYMLTAVFESYLTKYAESYNWFLYYFLITSSMIFFVAYIMYFKPETFKQISKKYYSSGLNEKDKKRIVDKLNKFLLEDNNIVDSSMDLSSLCKSINEKTHHVSQTISEELNTNFKDLINKHKIEHAKKMLSDRNNDHMKLFAIALDSGFSNKSTFHRVFVKFTNCTPNDYRKKSLI